MAIDIVFRYYNAIDRFDKSLLQLEGACALLIACHWGQQFPEDVDYFYYVTAQSYPKKQIINRTWFILKTINGLLWIPGLENVINKFDQLSAGLSVVKGWQKIGKFLETNTDFTRLL